MNKLIFAFSTSVVVLIGAVNDVIPSDYEAPQVDSTVMSINYLSKELRTKSLPNGYIKQNTYALRYTHGIDIDGKTLGLSFAIPYTALTSINNNLPAQIDTKSTGISDAILSATYWLTNDRKNKDFLAITTTLTLPNGKYDEKQILNSGENRYKSTLNIGYISKISNDIIIELSPEVAFYGDANTIYGKQSQQPSYALNTNIRYKTNLKYELFGGFQHNYQSETTINNIAKNDDCFYQKYSLGGAYYTDKFHQFMLRFAKESDKEFALKGEKELLLRYRWWFK